MTHDHPIRSSRVAEPCRPPRGRHSLLGTLLLLATSTAALTGQDPVRASGSASPLVVHEWGTFTSMVGSDGLVLEGLEHEEERLPEFVHELAELEGIGEQGGAVKFPARRVTQKMETPVIYFHTDVPRRVNVEVRFPQGLLTQFYPLPALLSPLIDRATAQAIDLTTIGRSLLIWDLELLPFDGPRPEQIPACPADDPWAFARDVRAAYVRTIDPPGLERATEAEHYVFYRGLARFELPFELRCAGEGRGSFHNGAGSAVPSAWVLELDATGGSFVELGALAPNARAEFDLATSKRIEDPTRVAAALAARVFDALRSAGLFEDEARAMIATWSRSWFQSRGTRAIYLLPRPEIDRVLPLSINPKPDEIVRVLVGRLEFIPPEREREVETALQNRKSADPTLRSAADDYLASLGRFLEPHVRRALATTTSDEVRASALELLTDDPR